MLLVLVLYIILILFILHSYLFYPVIIKSIAKRNKGIGKAESLPVVDFSVVISAFNEEKVIEARIKNISEQCYNLDNVEVIIGSDCSDDRTNEILKAAEMKYSWLKVVFFDQRRGKAAVLNDLVKLAKNEYLVFTDANTEFDENALKFLAESFNEPAVGGVCGKLILQEAASMQKESIEEKRYWDYETKIKDAEGKCGIVIGANGGIFAIRKNLYREIPLQKAVTDDFFISLSVLDCGFKFVYQNAAVAYENIGMKVMHEFQRKIRFAATNFQTLLYFKRLLLNKNILLSFAFWSHKIIRWFLPFIYLLILILNIFLLNVHWLFTAFIDFQIAFFILALAGLIFSISKVRISLFSIPYFFTLSNIALMFGFFRFLRKKHTIIWQPTPR
jgi:cellulose synthase/poly-beta-1,6-N-acetylglucosamine synthase-like glycosyltransferase